MYVRLLLKVKQRLLDGYNMSVSFPLNLFLHLMMLIIIRGYLGVKVLFRTAFTILKLTLTPTVLKECEGLGHYNCNSCDFLLNNEIKCLRSLSQLLSSFQIFLIIILSLLSLFEHTVL